MAQPTVSATLNKTTFNAGEQMVLTVTYGDADNRTESKTTTITGTDETGADAVVTVSRTVKYTDAVTLTVTEPGKTWTKQSDNGSVAVYTATA
jgi:hypothetical protein